MCGEAQGGREVFLCKDLVRRRVIIILFPENIHIRLCRFWCFQVGNITVQFVVELAREM